MTEATAGRGPIVIWNPAAGRKVGLPTNVDLDEAGVRALFAAGGLEIELCRTASEDDAAAAVERVVAAGDGRPIVAAGGDGTFRTVARRSSSWAATIRRPCRRSGSCRWAASMNVARSLDIPRDLEGAVRVIAEGHERSIDVGRGRRLGARSSRRSRSGCTPSCSPRPPRSTRATPGRRSARSGRRSATGRRA